MTRYGEVFQFGVPYTVIGNGAVEKLGTILKRFEPRKVLLVTDQGIVSIGLADKVTQLLRQKGIEHGIFDACKPDAPLGAIKNCAQVAKDGGYDLMIGLGGGSVMDTVKLASIVATAKDIAQEDMQSYLAGIDQRGLPKILLPTTAGTGSEWNFFSIITDERDNTKKAVKNDYLLAEAVIIDPSLTLDLPPKVTAETGMDALIHAIETYTSRGANLFSEMFSEYAIKLIAGNLRTAYAKGINHEDSRYNMSLAASIACLPAAFTGLGLVHGMSYPVAMKAHCSHGVSCSLMLPHVMEYNMFTNLPKFAKIAELMGEKVNNLSWRDAAQRAIEAVKQLSSDVGMPQRLRDVGVKKEDIPGFVDDLFTFQTRMLVANPRECSRDEAARIFEAAW